MYLLLINNVRVQSIRRLSGIDTLEFNISCSELLHQLTQRNRGVIEIYEAVDLGLITSERIFRQADTSLAKSTKAARYATEKTMRRTARTYIGHAVAEQLSFFSCLKPKMRAIIA